SLQKAIDEASANDIIYVKGKHEFQGEGAIEVLKPLTIKASPGSKEQPVIFASYALVDVSGDFTLSGLKLRGLATYTVDVSNATNTNVTFENCDVSGFTAGIFYASSDASASYSLLVTNSLFHNMGDMGGDFIDMRGGTLTRVELRNSTFWDLARRFISIGNDIEYTGNNTEGGEEYINRDAGDPPTITNCTIDNVASEAFIVTPQSNKYIVHV